MLNDPYTLILPHDTVWAIYEPAARQLWQMVGQISDPAGMAAHLADVASRPPTPAQAYLQTFGEASSKAGTDDTDEYKPYQMDGSVAVLTLSGALTKAGTSFSSAGSMTYAGRLVDLAARDSDVSAVILRVDSPGGTVAGTQALADRVTAAAAVKPVIAVIEDLCASAAYWVASGATRILANPTALVGSIGTYMAVSDYSRAAANAGVQVHVLSTGAHKGAGVPGAPITDAQLAAWQAMIDATNSHFLAAVSANRGIAPDALVPIADGRVFLAAEALALGLIDAIGTYETAIAELTLTSQENSMTIIEKVRAAFAGVSPSAETTETAEAIAAAADAQIAAQAAVSATALAVKDAEISRLLAASAQAGVDAASAQAEAAQAAADAAADANEAVIDSLVADFKLTPAASAQAASLRAADSAAFDALFAEMKALTPVAGTPARKVPAQRGGATKPAADIADALAGTASPYAQLDALANAKIAASPRTPYHIAFSAACAENPELAAAHVNA